MGFDSDKEFAHWDKAKRGLLRSLMKERFEAHMSEILESGNYGSMEELDGILDIELRKYYTEVNAVESFYEQKCS